MELISFYNDIFNDVSIIFKLIKRLIKFYEVSLKHKLNNLNFGEIHFA